MQSTPRQLLQLPRQRLPQLQPQLQLQQLWRWRIASDGCPAAPKQSFHLLLCQHPLAATGHWPLLR
jgi:hypothetical protein